MGYRVNSERIGMQDIKNHCFAKCLRGKKCKNFARLFIKNLLVKYLAVFIQKISFLFASSKKNFYLHSQEKAISLSHQNKFS